jgi:hypothetical protein
MSKQLTFDRSKASLLLKEGGVKAVVDYCYAIDAALYSRSKIQEGQYSYLQYIKKMRRVINFAFDEVLPGALLSVRNSLRTRSTDSRQVKSKSSIVVLNNTSLLGHVSVLCSMARDLNDSLGSSNLFVICLFTGKDYFEWEAEISGSGLQVLELSQLSPYDRLLEADLVLNPAQYIWWGWPPGQWLGPLVCPWAQHRSVSFKYDFPSAEHFVSHHIGYGEPYAKNISDQIPIHGFHQPISVESIPGLTPTSLQALVSSRTKNLRLIPFPQRERIQIGTLAREEKVSQPAFLSLVVDVLRSDKRLIFHWTGREKSSIVTSTFEHHGLSKRHKFHGWVDPADFLSKLDIYLDTFPYGTGLAFVAAGYLGLPVATLASPYEAHFSNILSDELKAILVQASPGDYGHWVLQIASGLREVPDPSSVHNYFLRCFDNAIINALPGQLAI